MTAKKIISGLIAFTTVIYILFVFFDRLPWSMVVCGLIAQAAHALIMSNFPFVQFLSLPFASAIVMLFINHYLAFSYFSNNWYQFSEVSISLKSNYFTILIRFLWLCFQILAFFTLCLWLVPFALFVSLSANDNVLPTVNERNPLMGMCLVSIKLVKIHDQYLILGDNDIVSNYFSSKGKKMGLLSLFNYAKESVLPQRNKKSF